MWQANLLSSSPPSVDLNYFGMFCSSLVAPARLGCLSSDYWIERGGQLVRLWASLVASGCLREMVALLSRLLPTPAPELGLDWTPLLPAALRFQILPQSWLDQYRPKPRLHTPPANSQVDKPRERSTGIKPSSLSVVYISTLAPNCQTESWVLTGPFQ